MWEFREGGNEQGNIKHLDLVLIDLKGDAIYAEIPPDAIPILKPQLSEQLIISINKFVVERAKPEYKVVQNPYMLRLNRRTIIAKSNAHDLGFPKYTFSLTPIEKLPQFVKNKERFLDVLGKITAVSNSARVRNTAGDLMMRRIIKLQDLSGNTMDLSLSGMRALEFNGDAVLRIGQMNHIIAIFVGTLMKQYKDGTQFLSGTAACRWYINENDIPTIKAFQRSLPLEATAVEKIDLLDEDQTRVAFEEKNLLQLNDIDPFTQKGERYQCTVTIIGIPEKQHWCYRACRVCSSKMIPAPDGFQCTKDGGCPSKQFEWRYSIPFIVADDTYSLEFVMFERKAAELIGKSAETLRKYNDPAIIPSDISQWIGHKFTFVVRILYKKSTRTKHPSFEVLLIKERHGKQEVLPLLNTQSSTQETGTSAPLLATKDLPELMTISSRKPTDEELAKLTQSVGEFDDMDIDNSPGNYDATPSATKRSHDDIEDDDKKQVFKKGKKSDVQPSTK
ncbi:unnamed protein product [Urochloa humidicola]